MNPQRKKLLLLLSIILLSILIYCIIPLPKPLFVNDYSTVVLDNNNQVLRVFLNRKEQYHFKPDTSGVPNKLAEATRFYEDEYFYLHPGVNPVSLVRALGQMIRRRQVVSGGSTITMQVARLIRQKPRTVWQKCIEICMALKIEIKYSKSEILKSYLDHAPYGGNIVGYQAATLNYYHKFPFELSWGEAATLAVLPNAPGLILPGKNQELLQQKRNRLLYKLFENQIIDQFTLAHALAEPLPDTKSGFAFHAPHFGQYIFDHYPGKTTLSTLNLSLQTEVKKMANDHMGYFRQFGIHNCAVLVAETRSGKIRAWIGSPDFFDAENAGQVDGILAPRSSGSILKPFLYALSMDRGLILPQSLIHDIPTSFGSFSPSNYDETFRGLITADDALRFSLNIPAVRLLNSYGTADFHYFLTTAGLTTIFRSPDDYGLSLILGGAEVKLLDMVNAYRILGNEGNYSSLQFTESDSATNFGTLISPAACWLTNELLKKVTRPGSEYYWQLFNDQYPLAWKTGTSYGHIDAWAIGVSPEWTIGVWIGNFTGESNEMLAGARCAGPLLFDVFNYLPKRPENAWFSKPESEMNQAVICRESGFLARPECPHKDTVSTPVFQQELRFCPYHHKIFVDDNEQYQVCSLCWESGHYHKKTVMVFPPDVGQYLRQTQLLLNPPPPHNPDCPGMAQENPLKIIYPQSNSKIWLPRELDGTHQKLLLKVAHRQDNIPVFWYVDQEYVGTTLNNHILPITLPEGQHKIYVIDQNGHSDTVIFSQEMN